MRSTANNDEAVKFERETEACTFWEWTSSEFPIFMPFVFKSRVSNLEHRRTSTSASCRSYNSSIFNYEDDVEMKQPRGMCTKKLVKQVVPKRNVHEQPCPIAKFVALIILSCINNAAPLSLQDTTASLSNE